MSPSRLRPSDPVPFGPLKHRPALAAATSAVIPGAGQWFQGRRRQAAPLLVLSAVGLLAAIGAIWVLNRRGPVYILEVAVRPGALALIFVLNALFMGVRAWAAADAYQGGQPIGGRGGAVAGAAVLALVVLPHLVIGTEAAQAHQVVTTVFQQPARARKSPSTSAPTWRPGERLTVLFLGAEQSRNRSRASGAMVVTVFPGDDRVAAVSLPANLTGIPAPPGVAGRMPGDGSLTDLYRFGNRHRRLYPGITNPGAAMVKDAVQSLLGIPVHHAVVFDATGLDWMDIVDNRTAARCAGAGVVRSLRPSGLLSRIPSMVGALGTSVTSDIPLDIVPDMVGLLPTLSPRRVITVPITAPEYGRIEKSSQVADPERVRAAMVSLVRLSPKEAADRLGVGDPARCGAGPSVEAAADNR